MVRELSLIHNFSLNELIVFSASGYAIVQNSAQKSVLLLGGYVHSVAGYNWWSR